VITTRWLKRAGVVLSTAVVIILLAACSPAAVAPPSAVNAEPAVTRAHRSSLEVDGLHRSVTIFDVLARASTLEPALILLHGAGGSSTRLESQTGMTAIARTDGFVVAYGDGTTTGRPVGGEAWNAGGCCAAAVTNKIDDIAYLNTVIDTLIAKHHVDPKRIYLGGFSNGGMMSYRAACEIGNRLAGIAVVSGALNLKDCIAPKALPLLIIHGLDDPTVPYDGGRPNPITAAKLGTWKNVSVAQSASYWATRDGCSAHSTKINTAVLTDDVYSGCDSGTKLSIITLLAGTHRWPTNFIEGFDASAYIVKYFGLGQNR
jgi:polyhydroxybutyrate depolymerase